MRQHHTAVALAFFAVVTSRASAQVDSAAAPPPPVVRHTVKRGDTLWDLAQYYLKDPFLWPEVFRVNTGTVKDPHWIYPGQVLSIPREAVRQDVAARADKDGYVVSRIKTRPAATPTVFLPAALPAPPSAVSTLEKPPTYTIRRGEYEAAPFVVDEKHPPSAGEIVGSVDRTALGLRSEAGFRFNDRLYVSVPAGLSLHRGDTLLLARRADVILDVGRVIEPTGILRIDSVQSDGPALGTIVKQFGPIMLDQITLPYERPSSPTTVRPVRGSYPVRTTVVWIRKHPPLPSIQTYVVLGGLTSAGVRPGDEFTVYDQGKADVAAKIPPVATARVQIVRVTPLGATGLIVGQAQPKVEEGMAATLTAKMP